MKVLRHVGGAACEASMTPNLQRSQIANQRDAPKILLGLLPWKHFGQSGKTSTVET